MSGQRPKRFGRAQVLATLSLLDEEDSGGSGAEDQENTSDWELFVSEKELSSKDEIENAPNLPFWLNLIALNCLMRVTVSCHLLFKKYR